MPQTQAQTQSIRDQQPDQPTRNGLQNDNSPNPSDQRNGPTCFRYGYHAHMRAECRKRVFCNHCRSYNHDTKTCRKQHNNTPNPCPQSNSNRLPPNSNTTTINGNNSSHTTNREHTTTRYSSY